jgi:hypothetical protein
MDILYYPSNAVRKFDGGLVIDMFRTVPIIAPYVRQGVIVLCCNSFAATPVLPRTSGHGHDALLGS